MSIIDEIGPVKALPKVLSMLVYGRSGTGKTTFGATFPTPSLVIDIREKGTDSIANVEGIDVVSVTKWSELEELYWHIIQCKKYKSIVLDQVSSMQELAVNQAMEEESKTMMSQRLWGIAGGHMKTWLLNYRDLTEHGINVLFLAHDRTNKSEGTDEDEVIDPQIGPRLMPSVAGILNGAVKVIGNTFIREVELEDQPKGVEYCMRLGPHAYYTTKMRNPLGTVTPESIINPTYQTIMSVLSEGEKKPIRKTLVKEK